MHTDTISTLPPELCPPLVDEQAALLRECRLALDDLIARRPMNAAMVCGSTSLGNLRASLYKYRQNQEEQTS